MADYTIQEILSQPQIWRRTLSLMRGPASPLNEIAPLLGDGPVLFTGCGSSYYLSHAAAAIWSRYVGGPASALPASEVMMYPEAHFSSGRTGTVMGVSRSGKTPETRAALRHLRQSLGWRAIGVTCYAGAPLLEECDGALVLAEAAEVSRFTTRALTATLLAVQMLAAARTLNAELERELLQLPDLAERLLARYRSAIQTLAETGNFNQYVYLGQGPYFGLASELMLKTKEIARTPAEAYHSLEFLHGPRYGADSSTLITVLLSDGGKASQLEFLPKLKSVGAQIAVVCERATPEVSANSDFVIELESGLSDYARLLLVMPLMQLFAYYRACALGKTAWIEEMVRLPDQDPQGR